MRVKSDKGKRREEKRRSILRLKMMNEGEEDEIDEKKKRIAGHGGWGGVYNPDD